MQQPQTQGLSPDEGLKYLAEVANTYAATLDPVARLPFVSHINASIMAIQNHVAHLRQELASGSAPLPPCGASGD